MTSWRVTLLSATASSDGDVDIYASEDCQPLLIADDRDAIRLRDTVTDALRSVMRAGIVRGALPTVARSWYSARRDSAALRRGIRGAAAVFARARRHVTIVDVRRRHLPRRACFFD